jgi:3-oxoacyl-[acyl-carrier-protein] synthase-1
MLPLAITACGLVTATGLNGPASLAAIRAGVRAVKQTNLWDPESGTYLAAGKAPLPQWWVGLGKLADLAATSILECLQHAQPASPESIPVLLGLPAHDRPFRLAHLDDEILSEIEHRLEFSLHPASHVVARDHVSAAAALREAADLIERGEARYVVVAAVDSLLVHDLKNYYLAKRRLLTPGNSNGFSLGEAGCAVLATASDDGNAGKLEILSASLGRETATIESEHPLKAVGLTEAIRNALCEARLTMDEIDYRLADLNGEHYKFKEMALAISRFARAARPDPFDIWHPIEYVGDVGAAIGPLLLAVALDAGRKEYGPGPASLCTLASDEGERAALVLRYRHEEGRIHEQERVCERQGNFREGR